MQTEVERLREVRERRDREFGSLENALKYLHDLEKKSGRSVRKTVRSRSSAAPKRAKRAAKV
jgi:hypothetical protein